MLTWCHLCIPLRIFFKYFLIVTRQRLPLKHKYYSLNRLTCGQINCGILKMAILAKIYEHQLNQRKVYTLASLSLFLSLSLSSSLSFLKREVKGVTYCIQFFYSNKLSRKQVLKLYFLSSLKRVNSLCPPFLTQLSLSLTHPQTLLFKLLLLHSLFFFHRVHLHLVLTFTFLSFSDRQLGDFLFFPCFYFLFSNIFCFNKITFWSNSAPFLVSYFN